jgi:hypothetical protein
MASWKEQAQHYRDEGYQTHQWASLLDRTLRQSRPDLVKELEKSGEYRDYLTAKSGMATDMVFRLEEQGTDLQTAKDLALADLLNPS